jgi:hypothetical protein
MKHPVKNILILFTVLCLITVYTDIKKGVVEGWNYKNEKLVKKPAADANNHSTLNDFTLPLIIKTY